MPKYAQHPSITKLFHYGHRLSFSKGEVVLGNSAKPDGVYFIQSGFIKVYTITDEGEEHLSIIYGHGEIFPLRWAYLGLEGESLFYESISECVLWRIPRDWFTEAITSDIATSHAFAVQMAQQFSVFIDRVHNLEYKKASERVAYIILFLASRFGKKNSNSQFMIDAPMTHQLFASSINLSRESVSREIEKLSRQGIIQNRNSQMVIKSMPGLVKQLTRPVNFKDWYW